VDLGQAAWLGLIQGLTEWLPISSTAHLRIVPAFLGWDDPGAAFTAAIQLGTLCAVLVYFYRDIVKIIRTWGQGLAQAPKRVEPEYRIGWGVVVGTIPIVILGLLFKDKIENEFRSLYVIAGALIGMGVLLLIADLVGAKRRRFEQTTFGDGLWVGLWQALALVPGASRSGCTITGALFAGLDRQTAARFSFVLSVPSVLGAGLLNIYSHRAELLGVDLAPMLLANAVSFVAGYASIAVLMSVIQRFGVLVFVAYRIGLGAFLLTALMNGRIEPSSAPSVAGHPSGVTIVE
jgi:undecaprenyl-diphosphatase